MKKIFKYVVLCLVLAAIGSCTKETTPERVNIQHPDEQSNFPRDNAYYQALRAYKQTKHKLAFGWYGSWTAVGASHQTRLSSAPDSMDIISIWSQWHTLTKQQKADKEFVQKTLGTKVIFTIFAHEVPEEFMDDGQVTAEGLARYAKAYAKDSLEKYNYDGIDLDYEPEWGGKGPLVDGVSVYYESNPDLRTYNDNMTIFVQELSRWVGPASGTGRLLVIDGVPFGVHPSVSQMFDYGIVQAYGASKASGTEFDETLQGRFNKAAVGGWRPEQYIFTENFESYWSTGGVTFEDREGNKMESLYGMALFNPTQGACAGFGTYHMEYEYANSAMPYKYMRNAIQLANPAGGWTTPIEVGFSATKATNFLYPTASDAANGPEKIEAMLAFSRPVISDMKIQLQIDNSLVSLYNEEFGTVYKTVDPSLVKVDPVTVAENQVFSPAVEISFDPASLSSGHYMIPISIDLDQVDGYALKEGAETYYVLISKAVNDIDTAASTLKGEKIAPTAAWTINAYMGTASSGANGVWNLDSDAQKAAMFDGALGSGWYAASQSYSWGSGGNFIIDMGEINDVTGFRWHILYSTGYESNPLCTNFAYSMDGEMWHSLTSGISFVPTLVDDWKYFNFERSVKARYLRVFVGPVTGYTSMNEAEIFGPAN